MCEDMQPFAKVNTLGRIAGSVNLFGRMSRSDIKFLSIIWQSFGNCLVNAVTDMQTNPPHPAANPPKMPGENRQKLFGARSGFWGLQPIMSSLYKRALGVRAPRVVFC